MKLTSKKLTPRELRAILKGAFISLGLIMTVIIIGYLLSIALPKLWHFMYPAGL